MRSVAWLALAVTPSLLFAQKKPFDASALLKIQRIADPQLSPDGKTVAFAVAVPDLDGNKNLHSVWTVPLEGGAPRKLADLADRPRWSPDGKRIFYVSTAGDASQIRSMNPDGSGASQVTHVSTEADGELVSPDGKYVIFTSSVFPECDAAASAFDDACNQRHLDAERQSKVKARVITGLLYRHWNAWQVNRRSHLLSISLADGKVADLSPGTRDVPPFSLGGPDDYAISPDGSEVCFAMNTDDIPAAGTNNDLFVVPIQGGQSHKITANPGADDSPLVFAGRQVSRLSFTGPRRI